ncbi:MAG: hypothetical protein M1834_002158 [Cirrosporium novae-zelandiae]|nr:MAG: hypothetical protein M1834_002158 [Cirrosporium novae-zelandiae]
MLSKFLDATSQILSRTFTNENPKPSQGSTALPIRPIGNDPLQDMAVTLPLSSELHAQKIGSNTAQDSEGINISGKRKIDVVDEGLSSANARKRRKSTTSTDKRRNKEDDATEVEASATLREDHHETSVARAHKRFDSTEPKPDQKVPLSDGNEKEKQSENERDSAELESSDDEAPEAVMNIAAVKSARDHDEEANKAIKRQNDILKEKRRKRDLQLREQAKSRKRIELETVNLESLLDQPEPSPKSTATFPNLFLIDQPTMPALLPEELLAHEPQPRPPTPTREHRKVLPKRIIFADKDEKPKDIKRGPVHVHVLDNDRSGRAPRASKEVRKQKESWLSKRRNGKGSFEVQRKVTFGSGGGFIRK